MWCLCHNVNLRCVFIYVNNVVFRWYWCGVVCLKNCCYLCSGKRCNICIWFEKCIKHERERKDRIADEVL